MRGYSKYGNHRVKVGGETFDSVKEAGRWEELNLLLRAGLIENLQRQVRYELLPTQKDGRGKVLERSVAYIADFVYTDRKTGNIVVEDTKGMKTKEYIIKRKLMLYIHNIRIAEI